MTIGGDCKVGESGTDDLHM